MSDDSQWNRLLETVSEIQEWFPDGLAFIGGIAVYAYLYESDEFRELAAQSHDADFVILLRDMADLRDIEALTPNNRLSKQQFIKNGFEFDVYVEGQHALPVDTSDAVAYSQVRNGLRVVCPEHLLKMKVYAYNDRKGTAKGDKDEQDIIRVFLTLNEVSDAVNLLDEDDLKTIEGILNSNAYIKMTRGNAHRARQLREICKTNFVPIKQALGFSP